MNARKICTEGLSFQVELIVSYVSFSVFRKTRKRIEGIQVFALYQ